MNDVDDASRWSDEFRRLADFEQQLQRSYQGHFQSVLRATAGDGSPGATWLRMSHAASCESKVAWEHLPQGAREAWRGWLAYYSGDYSAAAGAFSTCMKTACSEMELVSAALGFGKVATRLGQWSLARDWTLLALHKARRSDRLFDVVRGYGALGEIMLRSGRLERAMVCFGAARRLLPPGSGDRNRQLNYLASALSRIGDEAARTEAESLLMSSLRMATDRQDTAGVDHVLARLQFLELDRQGSDDIPQRLRVEPNSLAAPAPVAVGFLQMGRAIAAIRRSEIELAVSHARAAAAAFNKGLPMEKRWADLLIAALTNQIVTEFQPPLASLPCPQPSYGVVDEIFARETLSNDGFQCLAETHADMDKVWACRRSFFI